jgi:hypothetical protein
MVRHNIPSIVPTVVSEKRERLTFMLGPVLHLPASVFRKIVHLEKLFRSAKHCQCNVANLQDEFKNKF